MTDPVDLSDTQENLRMSTVDKNYLQSPSIATSQEFQHVDMPLVEEEFVFTQGFILDSTTYGVLDTSAMDALTESYTLVKVTCPQDVFNWFATSKEETLLKHSSSNATVSNTAQTITFTAGQILVLVCYKDTYTVQTGTVNIDGAVFDNIANYTFALSANGGSSYTNVTNGTAYSFPVVDQGTELRVRITATAAGTITLRANNGTYNPLQVRFSKV